MTSDFREKRCRTTNWAATPSIGNVADQKHTLAHVGRVQNKAEPNANIYKGYVPTEFNDSSVVTIETCPHVRPIPFSQTLLDDAGNTTKVRCPHFSAQCKELVDARDHRFNRAFSA